MSYVSSKYEMLKFLKTCIPLLVSANYENDAYKSVDPTVNQNDCIGTVPAHEDEVEYPSCCKDHEAYEVQSLQESQFLRVLLLGLLFKFRWWKLCQRVVKQRIH